MRPIFLHSLWRSGSTYAWMKFRRLPTCCAFYEPFNETLATLTVDSALAYQSDPGLIHPAVIRPYFYEYIPLLVNHASGNKGLPLFKDEFSYRNYFIADQELPEQKAYITSLIAEATRQGKVPVLGFVRSLGRVAWFRRQFDAVNIVLVRNLLSQFLSCEKQAEAGRPFFRTMYYMVLCQAPRGSIAADYAEKFDIPRFDAQSSGIARQQLIKRVTGASLAERFQVSAALYRLSHLMGNRFADLLVDMDRLSTEPDYRDEISATIHSLTGFKIDFSGMNLPRHIDHSAAANLVDPRLKNFALMSESIAQR